MMDKVLHIVFLMVVLVLSAHSMQAQSASPDTTAFAELTQKFENGRVFHADFTHTYSDAFTGDTSKQAGEIWIGGESYKIDSPSQLVAVDGKISRVYDSQRNRLIISEYIPEEDDFAPSRILNGVDSTYTIDSQQKLGDNYIIKLNSDDPFAMFSEVEITLNEQGIPTKIFVIDTAENEITTTFSGGSFVDPKANMFDISYPENSEIIDMRN